MLVLVAASDGASPELAARVSELSPEPLSPSARFTRLGLELREGRAVDVAGGLSELTATDSAALSSFARAVLARDVEGADRALRGASVTVRGYAYSIGVVALRERAPAKWRNGAQRLLFVPERPYFTSADAAGRPTSL
jgi:hypothetical protein